SALSGLGRYPGADVHGGERTRATGAGRAALAPGRERPAAAGPAGRWKPWGRGGRHAAAGASLQGGEGLAGGGVVGVDLYGPLVGVAGALRVALAAAALVGLAEPVVGLGAGRRGEESAVLGALDRLVDLAGLEVGPGQVREQRGQEHRAVHLHGPLEPRQAGLDVAAL